MQKLGLGSKTQSADLVAGVVKAVTSIPDGLGSTVLAGFNPINGLYAIMVGTPMGALTTGSVFMNVSMHQRHGPCPGSSKAGYADPIVSNSVMTGVLTDGCRPHRPRPTQRPDRVLAEKRHPFGIS